MLTSCSRIDQKSFDAIEWKKGSPIDRGEMVFDLVGISTSQWRQRKNWISSSQRLSELDRLEVIELLGPPDAEVKISTVDGGVASEKEFFYDVGPLDKSGVMKEPCSLNIRFSEDQFVVYISIVD